MSELMVLAVVCILALSVVCGVLALSLRSRARSDAGLFGKLCDQLISNSDFQIRRQEIEEQVAMAKMAQAAARNVITESVHSNGDLTGGELPDYATTPR